jgi:hypothetical protein
MTEEEMLAAHALFLKKDWLTPGPIAEIHRHFPQKEDICADTGQRSMESFKNHCLKLFPLNRVFASSSQISQTAKEFCDAWGIGSTCLGKNVVCYYGKSPTRNRPQQRVHLGVTRMWVPSLKSQECPFEIRFDWIKLNKHVAKTSNGVLCFLFAMIKAISIGKTACASTDLFLALQHVT